MQGCEQGYRSGGIAGSQDGSRRVFFEQDVARTNLDRDRPRSAVGFGDRLKNLLLFNVSFG